MRPDLGKKGALAPRDWRPRIHTMFKLFLSAPRRALSGWHESRSRFCKEACFGILFFCSVLAKNIVVKFDQGLSKSSGQCIIHHRSYFALVLSSISDNINDTQVLQLLIQTTTVTSLLCLLNNENSHVIGAWRNPSSVRANTHDSEAATFKCLTWNFQAHWQVTVSIFDIQPKLLKPRRVTFESASLPMAAQISRATSKWSSIQRIASWSALMAAWWPCSSSMWVFNFSWRS